VGLLCGAAGLGIAGTYLWIAVRSGSFLPVPGLDVESVVAFFLLAVSFQYAAPALAATASLCAFAARGHWAGRLGLCFALTALLIYLLFLRACYSALTAGDG